MLALNQRQPSMLGLLVTLVAAGVAAHYFDLAGVALVGFVATLFIRQD